jgi:hypothetical protein
MRDFGRSPIPRADASPHKYRDNDNIAVKGYVEKQM